MERAIFISYRRDDSEGEAGRLYDDLARSFGNDFVFMDVSGIDPGVDFRKAIDDSVGGCSVLLAMIGPTWATITGSDGQRRLDNENDYVRLEIASALQRNIAVIPVLVHDAHMPHADQLPDNLKDLAYRNSVEITHARWNSDVQLLIQALAHYVHTSPATEADPVHATIPVQLPPSRGHEAPAPAKSKLPVWLGAGGVALVLIVAALVFALRGSGSPSAVATTSPAPPAGNPAPASSAAISAPPVPRANNPLLGRWTNPDAAGRNTLAELDVTGSGSQLSIHAWGLCRPANCNWGAQPAAFDGQKARATWSMSGGDAAGQEPGRIATVTISPDGSGRLAVLVANTYSHHPATSHQFTFTPAP